MQLKAPKTHQNSRTPSRANRKPSRYLYFASKADVEGQNDVAGFPLDAKARPPAHGHLDTSSRWATRHGLPIGRPRQPESLVAGETTSTRTCTGDGQGLRDEG